MLRSFLGSSRRRHTRCSGVSWAQAEDGIRDAQESRGLGDVYKRQVVELVGALARAAARQLGGSCSPWRLAAVVSGGRLLGPNGPDLLPGWGRAATRAGSGRAGCEPLQVGLVGSHRAGREAKGQLRERTRRSGGDPPGPGPGGGAVPLRPDLKKQ